MSVDVSVVVPTRNEASTIVACVERIFKVCPEAEVLVIDGGQDASALALAPLQQRFDRLRYISNAHDRGKGHAVAVGVQASQGRFIAVVDADLQFPPEDLPLVLAPLRAGVADVSLGSRFQAASRRAPGSVPGIRSFGNHAISGLASAACGITLSDVLAGLKAWRREVTAAYTWQSDGFSYEVELPIKAVRLGFRLAEVAVSTEPRRAGQSSVRVWRTGVTLCVDMLRFRLLPLKQGNGR
jgi:glycosyltransferase involved in cell wall biosynthesis